MIEHVRRHTGEKSVACRECGKTFRQLSTLYRHRKIHSRARLQKGDEAEAISTGQLDCGRVTGGDLKTVPASNPQIELKGEVYGESE